MVMDNMIALAAALLLSPAQPVVENLVIGEVGNWVIEEPTLNSIQLACPLSKSRSSITQLPNYPITKFVLFQRGRPRGQTSDELQQAESLMESQKFAEAEAQL